MPQHHGAMLGLPHVMHRIASHPISPRVLCMDPRQLTRQQRVAAAAHDAAAAPLKAVQAQLLVHDLLVRLRQHHDLRPSKQVPHAAG